MIDMDIAEGVPDAPSKPKPEPEPADHPLSWRSRHEQGKAEEAKERPAQMTEPETPDAETGPEVSPSNGRAGGDARISVGSEASEGGDVWPALRRAVQLYA